MTTCISCQPITDRLTHFLLWLQSLHITALSAFSGYGFVDFDSPAAAQKAVAALKTTGVQAQMAKVRIHYIAILISHLDMSSTVTLNTQI